MDRRDVRDRNPGHIRVFTVWSQSVFHKLGQQSVFIYRVYVVDNICLFKDHGITVRLAVLHDLIGHSRRSRDKSFQ